MKRFFSGGVSVFCMTYAIICVAAAMIFAAQVRGMSGQRAYHLRVARSQERRIMQSVRQKQIELERLINPASVSGRMAEEESKD